MSTVATILGHKGTNVVTIDQHATVLDAARAMNQHRIGSVVVTCPKSSGASSSGASSSGASSAGIVGILTERDILTRVVALCKDPMRTLVSDAMTHPVQTCTPETPVDEVRNAMREQRIRHVPVLQDQALAGMVSIGDLNAYAALELTSTVETLEAYIARA
jgi:CBS domain-containing protein